MKVGFLDASVGRISACSAGDIGDADSIPGLVKTSGEGNGNPLQYSCLKNPMDRGADGLQSKETQLSDLAHMNLLLCATDNLELMKLRLKLRIVQLLTARLLCLSL